MDEDIGQRLRARRDELGISREKLGRAVDLSAQQIYRYERGDNVPSADRLRALAEALSVQPGWLLGHEVGEVAPALAELLASPEGASLTDDERATLESIQWHGVEASPQLYMMIVQAMRVAGARR